MVSDKDEQLLIAQARNGNQSAFAALVDRYKEMVFRTSIGFLHNEDDANDIVQEVFVQMYKSLDEFRGDSKLSTWLYRIAVNRSLNVIRSRKSRSWMQNVGSFFVGEKPELQVQDESADAASEVENTDTANALNQALAELPENQRTAFVLSKYEDLSYTEISEVMNVSVSSIESLLFRAKKNLQKKLIHVYRQL